MSRWFRFYDDAMHDPKLLRLSDATYRAWTILLCIASKNEGVLPPASDIALMLRIKPAMVAAWVAELSSVELLDSTDAGFVPHNWGGRQYKSDKQDDTAAERMRKYRERKRVSDVTLRPVTERNAVTVTVPRTDTDTDTEQKETRAAALDDWPSDFREQFWNGYPHKIGKSDAIAKLERVRKRGVSWVILVDGLRRYVASKPVDRPWCNPATWLNQARWEDQPAGSVVQISDGAGIDWDAVLTSFKRFGVWSKHAGPDLDSPECRVPADMLAKYGLLRADEINPRDAPRLKSIGGLN